MYSGFSTGNGNLQYDQEPIAFMSERMKPFDVQDHRNPQIITNTPHTKDIEQRIMLRIKPWLIKPNIVYQRVCDSARTLPYLDRLEELLSPIYANKLIENIIRLNINAANYYQKILEKQISFEKYQEFFYLLILIQEVDKRKNQEEFQQLQDGIQNVIEWIRTRIIEDIEYFIQGPTKNQMVTLDYEETYKGLISPSNTTKTVTEYLQLTTMQQINDQLTLTRHEANVRKNVYDKNPNIAGSYLLSIDSELNAELYINTTQDLVVNCQNIDLGNSNSEKVDLNIHSAELTDKLLKHDPKNASKKLENLLNTYTIFSIKNLLILKSTYKTSLDAFDKIYVVFPGITMDGRFNQVYPTGTLQISGHFIQSDNEKYWEFVPDSDIGNVYNPTTAHVESFDFYISNNPGSKTNLSYNNFKISTHLNEYFNCPIIIQNFEELEPNIYIIRLNDITEGELKVLPYTFIYNDNIKTIQLLPTNYTFDTIPRYKAKKMRRTQQKYEANVYPEQPSTINVILDEIRQAKFEAKIKGSDKVVIYLDKPVQPATIEGINKRIKNGEKSWTFRGQTVDFSGKTVEQIVKEFNQREYDVSNVVDYTKDYINKLKASTVNYKNKKYSLIKANGQRMTGHEFFASLGIENSVDCATRISDELMNEYKMEMARFDPEILPEQVNPVYDEPKPEDFASLTEYYLFLGLFKPDYDYIIQNSPDIDPVVGQYATENGRLERVHDYYITDFYAKDFVENMVSIENPEGREQPCIVEEVEMIDIVDNQCKLKTTIIRYPEEKVISSNIENATFTPIDDYFVLINDNIKFLKNKEITKYIIDEKTYLQFEDKIGKSAFIQDYEKLYIQFNDSELVIYENTDAQQHISNVKFTPNAQVIFPPGCDMAGMVYIDTSGVEYNVINFQCTTGSVDLITDILEVEIDGVKTLYYKQIPGFSVGMHLNMFRALGNDVYELLSFDTTDSFLNVPDDGTYAEIHVVDNKNSILFKHNIKEGNNYVEDLKLHVNYGMARNKDNYFDIVEKVEYFKGNIMISNYKPINLLLRFDKNDLNKDFKTNKEYINTDWVYNNDCSEQYKDEIVKDTKYNQELYEKDNNCIFEFYTTYGIKDFRTTKTFIDEEGKPYADVMGIVNKTIDNEYNKIIGNFKGKYFTYPIKYADKEKADSENELKNCIIGDIFGYLDENDEFVESYYVQYNNENVLDFEVVNNYKDIFTYNNKLQFSDLWRRTTLNIETQSSFDVNNIVSVDFVKRTIPLEDNIYKTFKVGIDVLHTKFGIDDYLYSYAKFINAKIIDKPYRELVDMKIKDVGYYERLEYGNSGFDDPVKPKYFINYISHFKPGLIINSPDYGFNTYSVSFKNTEYILETINKDLFGISYNTPISDPDNFYSRGSRIKMLIKLE